MFSFDSHSLRVLFLFCLDNRQSGKGFLCRNFYAWLD